MMIPTSTSCISVNVGTISKERVQKLQNDMVFILVYDTPNDKPRQAKLWGNRNQLFSEIKQDADRHEFIHQHKIPITVKNHYKKYIVVYKLKEKSRCDYELVNCLTPEELMPNNDTHLVFSLTYRYPGGKEVRYKTCSDRYVAFAAAKSAIKLSDHCGEDSRHLVTYEMVEETRWDWEQLVEVYRQISKLGIAHGKDVKTFLNRLDNAGELTNDITLVIFKNSKDCEEACRFIKNENITTRRRKHIMCLRGKDVDFALANISLSFNAKVINGEFCKDFHQYQLSGY